MAHRRISIGAHLRGGFWPSCPEERVPPRARRSHKTLRANTRTYALLETHPPRKEKKKRKRERVAHNGSVPIPPRLYPALPPPPLYTVRPTLRARVCHWEFPKYISPCVLLSTEEWPEFHSFLHLFLRFYKRREGDRVSGLSLRRRALALRYAGQPRAFHARVFTEGSGQPLFPAAGVYEARLKSRAK